MSFSMLHRCVVAVRKLACALVLAAVSVVSAPGATEPATPPALAFYGPPAIEAAVLSPSGKWLAMTTGTGGTRIGLAVFDLDAWKPFAITAKFSDADIDDFAWVDDERLVFDVQDRTRGSGDQRWWPGLFAVDRDGKRLLQLVKLNSPFLVGHRVGREPLEPWHRLLQVPTQVPGEEREVVVGEYVFSAADEFTGIRARRLNVDTGRVRELARGAPANAWQWLFDPDGDPRMVVTRREGRSELFWRSGDTTEWRPVAEWNVFKAAFQPRFVDRDGNLYVTTAQGRGGYRVLRRFDFTTGKPAEDALVSAPGFDFNGTIVAERSGDRALGVRLTTDAETTAWFDPKMAALQKLADARFPGRVNRLSCRRCGTPDAVSLLFSFNDRHPGEYWIHQAATGEWRKVGDRRPLVDPQRMADTEFARVKARDGIELPVWITRPAGKERRPAVVLVHGGPWNRGRSWSWDADAQFLASRGYVVIEPEFRGSTGYGEALHRAGFRQWGQAMQDDLVDALKWAVAQGWVDPERVCIAGASYGGYATLMGLARHGEHFRCGVAWVGVSDPRLMFQWRHDSDMISEHREHSYTTLIGDPVADKSMLDANTPLLLADRIKAPLLLAYGSNDRRVPLVHGTRMRDALVAAGRPPEWIVYEGEGHGWLKLETRLDFAQRLEDFLARHLQAAKPPAQ
jgi:dipeptidyl aminopeptidase/acylaminoacyl peptidase